MKKITSWEWWYPKKKIWKHHHIEDGWSESEMPTPFFANQARAWKNTKFRKEHMYLSSDNVVVGKEKVDVPPQNT